jgi:hypothetical protein|tara:strand:- start:302 stop:721 length:420 start_codon:yes stop_codon:yes gene_type:complete
MSTTITTSNDVLRARSSQVLLTDSASIYANQAGEEINIATDAKVITLPAIDANNIGMELTIRNTGADANNIVTISPAAADSISGSIALAASVFSASGVANKDLVNTKATAISGDFVTLKAVSVNKWFITAGIGIWASEA